MGRILAEPGSVRPRKPTSISISLAINGVPVYERGYGEAAPNQPANTDTRYLVGSVSKQFTAALVLRAIEERAILAGTDTVLRLDTPMSAVFQGIEHWNGDHGSVMTVERLLTMTSNLPNFTVQPPRGFDPWGSAPAEHLLGAFKKLRPGKGWSGTFRYSNTSYFMLAEMLDRLSGKNNENLATYYGRMKRLFADTGLTATGFVGEITSPREIASPSYRRRPAFLKPDWLKGSGDLVSTARDLNRWNRALFTGDVLGKEARQLMFGENARVTPSMWYGMGWFVEERRDRAVFSHSGFVPGFTSLNEIVQSKLNANWASIVLLTNADELHELDRIADDLAFLLLFER